MLVPNALRCLGPEPRYKLVKYTKTLNKSKKAPYYYGRFDMDLPSLLNGCSVWGSAGKARWAAAAINRFRFRRLGIRNQTIYQYSLFWCAALFRTLFMKLYLGNSPHMLLESINEQLSFSLDEWEAEPVRILDNTGSLARWFMTLHQGDSYYTLPLSGGLDSHNMH